jgi:hypothetical protein
MIGFDYTARIDPAALKAAKCSVVVRYTTWLGWPKSETHAEAVELAAAGIPVVANFETTADRMRGAGPAGHADAVEALGHLADLGEPLGVKVWFSADWDVQDTEVILCLDYLHAAADALGGKQYVGCYGGYRMVGAAANAGFAIWQTTAWSYGRWDPRTAARQTGEQRIVGGVTVDVNDILNLAALGAWLPTAAGGTDMGTIPASIGQKFPDLAGDFPANATFDPSTALIWADARAAAAALFGQQANAKLDQLLARQAAPVDVDALSAALAPLIQTGASADDVATAVVAHLATKLGAP